jgi:hypothetical protein
MSGLAFIIAVLLWQAPPIRYAHLTALRLA